MNILFISALEVKEKGAQSIRMTLEGYAKAGHQVTFLTQFKTGGRDYFYEDSYVTSLENFQIVKFRLPFSWLASKSAKINRFRNVYIFIAVSFLRGLWLEMNRKFDIVYGYEAQGVISARGIAFLTGLRLVSRFQGTILWPLINSDKVTDQKNLKINWYQGYAMKLKSDLFIMTNDGTFGDKVLDYFKAPKVKVKFWMNGVNKSIYQPEYDNFLHKKYKIPKKARILITVHRLTYWKRTDRTLLALAEILKKQKDVFLVIVGEGERSEDLKRMSEELKITKNVIFAGGVPNKDVGKYLNGADIYLGTYDLSNAGNPLFESMLSGLAVISLDNGSTADFLGNGKAGILIKDEKEFSSKIVELLKSEKELLKWKNLAKNYSHQKFWTWEERIATEITEVENLLNS